MEGRIRSGFLDLPGGKIDEAQPPWRTVGPLPNRRSEKI
jgi:hypothetical protein